MLRWIQGKRASAAVKWLNKSRKQLAVVLLSVLGAAASAWVGIRFDWWRAGIVVLAVAIVATVSPIVFSFLGMSELNPTGVWFDETDRLGTEKTRVREHYSRIKGTLRFWKNKAAAHQRLHSARVLWSLVSAVSLPVLVQRFDKSNPWSVLFMTMLTSWSGFIVSLAYTLKSEEKYQGFRQQESDYYDAGRHLLDFASSEPAKLKQEVESSSRRSMQFGKSDVGWKQVALPRHYDAIRGVIRAERLLGAC
jgi:hypothetical protein